MSTPENPWQAPAKAYDKLLISLTTGALVLTVGFVKDVVQLPQAKDLYLLFSSWSSLALALLTTLVGYVGAIEAEGLPPIGRAARRPLVRLLRTANLSLVCFGIGIGLFIWFLVLNIPTAAVVEGTASHS